MIASLAMYVMPVAAASIIALVAKVTLVLALGLLVTSRVRRSAPELRHMLLLIAIVASMALPLALVIAPTWDAPILPPSDVRATTNTGDVTAREHANATSPQAPAITSAPATQIAQMASRTSRVTLFTREMLGTALALLWLAGIATVLLAIAAGRLRLRVVRNRAWALQLPEWRTLLEQECVRARVTKDVALLVSPVASTPLTWGSRSAVILLPEDALEWPEDHRRVVLRHELAHVVRYDALAQLLAAVTCALYWFHPLVWIAARRLRAECERACDDRVLVSGTPAAEYAAHLLEVARSARSLGGPGFLSVAMARPSQLEGRLLAILDDNRQRIALSRRTRWVAIALSAAIVVIVSAFRPVARTASEVAPRAFAIVPTVASPTLASASVVPAADLPALVRAITPGATDSSFEKSVNVRVGETLTLDLEHTGAEITITGWNESRVRVRGSLGGRSWRETEVGLVADGGGALLRTRYLGSSRTTTFSNRFEIQVPRRFNVEISSAGGSITIADVDGTFRGSTGGGSIDIRRAAGDVRLGTGGGDIRVADSNLRGSVSTGGGAVRIDNVKGGLTGSSGSGDVLYDNRNADRATSNSVRPREENRPRYIIDGVEASDEEAARMGLGRSRTTTSGSSTTTLVSADQSGVDERFGANGIRRNKAGGHIVLDEAPDGARLTTGGGAIRVGASSGEVFASTGGGPIDIGPAAGSVVATTGAGDVTVMFTGRGVHSADIRSGRGRATLVLPADISATLILETAYTENHGRKTRIQSDWPLTITESPEWDGSVGTPRRYVRSRLVLGAGEGVIRVRVVNGDVSVRRSP